MLAAFWPLLIAVFVLWQIARNSASRNSSAQDWLDVPEAIRTLMQRAKSVMMLLFGIPVVLKILGWNSTEHARAYRLSVWIGIGFDIAFLFALEALFFRYGEFRSASDRERHSTQP
jgi:hypothetical protein